MVIEIFEKIDTYKRLNETDTFFRIFLDIQLRSIFFFIKYQLSNQKSYYDNDFHTS